MTSPPSRAARPILPYPWYALPKGRRASALVARALRPHAASIAAALAEVLGRPPGDVRVVALTADGGAPADGVAIAFAPGGGGGGGGAEACVEVDPRLAAILAARAAGDARSPVVARSSPSAPSPVVVGGIAASLAAVLSRLVPDGVVVVGPRAVETFDPRGRATLSIAIDGATHVARVHAPAAIARAALERAAAGRFTDLGDAPISIPIVAAIASIPAASFADLVVGDAIGVPASSGSFGKRDGAWTGAVALAARTASSGVAAELVPGGALVLRGGVEELGMTDLETGRDDAGSIADAIAETPVIVRIEIGAATLPARAWGALRPGDVVASDAKIGAPVVLSIAGRVVGRGELVDLEGDVGVRITSFVASEQA